MGTKRDLISDVNYRDVEEEAVKIAKKMNAEYWCVSSKTGAKVKDFFFRVAALSFEQLIMKELEQIEHRPSTQIGEGKIKLTPDLYEEGEETGRKFSCCKT